MGSSDKWECRRSYLNFIEQRFTIPGMNMLQQINWKKTYDPMQNGAKNVNSVQEEMKMGIKHMCE